MSTNEMGQGLKAWENLYPTQFSFHPGRSGHYYPKIGYLWIPDDPKDCCPNAMTSNGQWVGTVLNKLEQR